MRTTGAITLLVAALAVVGRIADLVIRQAAGIVIERARQRSMLSALAIAPPGSAALVEHPDGTVTVMVRAAESMQQGEGEPA